MSSIKSILDFVVQAEKLKTELRHSWTSNVDRQESVAEHTWMMSLLAVLLFDKTKVSVDKLRCLKMIIVHDLAEAIIGDIPAFEKSERKTNKYDNESKAIRELARKLNDNSLADEIVSLWEEFEKGESGEAKLAKAIDKIEVIIQHNNTDIKTWGDGDYELNPYYCDDKFNFDEFMRAFKDIVDADTMQKIESNNSLHRVNDKHRQIWNKKKLTSRR